MYLLCYTCIIGFIYIYIYIYIYIHIYIHIYIYTYIYIYIYLLFKNTGIIAVYYTSCFCASVSVCVRVRALCAYVRTFLWATPQVWSYIYIYIYIYIYSVGEQNNISKSEIRLKYGSVVPVLLLREWATRSTAFIVMTKGLDR